MATIQPCLRPGGKRYKAVFFLKKKKKCHKQRRKSIIPQMKVLSNHDGNK